MIDTVDNNQEDVAVPKWPTIWKYSLVSAVCVIAYTQVLYMTGMAGKIGTSWIATIIFIILLVLAMRKYRTLNGGYMEFGTATVIGILISVIESVLHSAYNAVYLCYINKTILPAIMDAVEKNLRNNPAMNQQQLDMIMRIFENFVFTPVGIFISGTVRGIVGGIIIALIVAAILKKAKPVTA